MLLIFSVNTHKHKEGITIASAIQQILNESNRKPNKMWLDKGNEFYNRLK